MKMRMYLFSALLLIVGHKSFAQGFRVYKSDGTYVTYSTKADSIVFFDGENVEDTLNLPSIPKTVDGMKPYMVCANEHTAIIGGLIDCSTFRTGCLTSSWRLLINTTGNPTRDNADYNIRYDRSTIVFPSENRTDLYYLQLSRNPDHLVQYSPGQYRYQNNYSLCGLIPNTKYYVRALLRLDDEDYYTDVLSFKTIETMDSCVLHRDDLRWFGVHDGSYGSYRILPPAKTIEEVRKRYEKEDTLGLFDEKVIALEWLRYLERTGDSPIDKCKNTIECSDGVIYLLEDANYLEQSILSNSIVNTAIPPTEHLINTSATVGGIEEVEADGGLYWKLTPKGNALPHQIYVFPIMSKPGKKYRITVTTPIDAETLGNDTCFNRFKLLVQYAAAVFPTVKWANGEYERYKFDHYNIALKNESVLEEYTTNGKKVEYSTLEFETPRFTPYVRLDILGSATYNQLNNHGYIRELRIAQIKIEETE